MTIDDKCNNTLHLTIAALLKKGIMLMPTAITLLMDLVDFLRYIETNINFYVNDNSR